MIYGITPQGFRAKRLPEIKAEIEAILTEKFGAIDLRAESIFGQNIGVGSDLKAQIWALAEAIYNSQYPDTASGVSLDFAVSLNGITRLIPTATTVIAVAYGLNGTVITAGRQASNGTDSYVVASSTTISADNAAYARIAIGSVAAVDYTITINGTPYTHTAMMGATESSILTGLQSALVGAPVVVSVTTFIEITGAFSVSVSSNLTIQEVGSNVPFVASELGQKVLLANTLTQIITPVIGWNRVNNLVAGSTGRNLETDTELLQRRNESIQIGASTTVGAIVANIRQVSGVLDAAVYPNNTQTTNAEGTPRQHVWVIVEGGSSIDIANVLYSKVAAGIGYRGMVEQIVIDPTTEQSFLVKFDRPTPITPLIDIAVDVGAGAPPDVINAVKQALVNLPMRIGQTLFYSRLFCPVNNIAGVTVQDLEVNGLKENIMPMPNERVVILPENITVTIV